MVEILSGEGIVYSDRLPAITRPIKVDVFAPAIPQFGQRAMRRFAINHCARDPKLRGLPRFRAADGWLSDLVPLGWIVLVRRTRVGASGDDGGLCVRGGGPDHYREGNVAGGEVWIACSRCKEGVVKQGGCSLPTGRALECAGIREDSRALDLVDTPILQ